jgi:eukaryotic-like serine/threonine-protein kinase
VPKELCPPVPTPPDSGPAISPSSVRPAVPEPGTVILGKYRVIKSLGSGGMGAVLAAHHVLLDQPIAIKCLSPTVLDSPAVIERFTREARAAARIASEHVVRIIDIAEFENGLPFIVMEYLSGEDLADHLARVGPLRISTAVRYILEACEVLAEAHGAKIIHRDIKPANLFLAKQRDKRQIIKVLDFGISKVSDEALTEASAMLGTLRYMSPEQLRSAKEVDHRTDIWALGAVLYELLTGVPPFDDSNMANLVAAVFENKRLPVVQLRGDIPEGLGAVIERCLETDPAKRFPNVLEMARELAPFAKESDRLSLDTIKRVLSTTLPPESQVPSSGARDERLSADARERVATVVTDVDATEMTDTLLSKLEPPPPSNGGVVVPGTVVQADRPAAVANAAAKAKEKDVSPRGKSLGLEKTTPEANAVPNERESGKERTSTRSKVAKEKEPTSERNGARQAPAAKDSASSRKMKVADAAPDSVPVVAPPKRRPPDPEGQTSYVRLAVIALVTAVIFALIGTLIVRTVFGPVPDVPPPSPSQTP